MSGRSLRDRSRAGPFRDTRIEERVRQRQVAGGSANYVKPIPGDVLDAICRPMHECPSFRRDDGSEESPKSFCSTGDEECRCYGAIRRLITAAKKAMEARPGIGPGRWSRDHGEEE